MISQWSLLFVLVCIIIPTLIIGQTTINLKKKNFKYIYIDVTQFSSKDHGSESALDKQGKFFQEKLFRYKHPKGTQVKLKWSKN